MVREILVVPYDKIFREKFFLGFSPLNEKDYMKDILENFEYKERNDSLENDSSFQQIISYVWLINRKIGKVFLYQRAISAGDYKEMRHVSKISGGVGGHIDFDSEGKMENPVFGAMIRELKEEVIMKEYPTPEIIGYIHDEADMYNKVHTGVVGVVFTNEEKVIPADGMKSGEFYSVEEVESILADSGNQIENWTKISWPFVRDLI